MPISDRRRTDERHRSRRTARSRLRCVIFDVWGTLVPFPIAAAAEIVARMADALSVRRELFAGVWANDFDTRATGDLEASLRRVCRTLELDPTDTTIGQALDQRIAAHRAWFIPRPSAVATVAELRRRGFRLGVITDCTTEDLWAESSLAPLVDIAVFSCVERVKKPDPRIYEIACRRLAVEPAECLYVGDGASDELEGAAALGMRAVQLRSGDTDARPWPGEWISSLSDVVGLTAGAHSAP